jgi:predicted dehydrogenase
VGAGVFGRQFIRLFAFHPEVSRIALCDREAERVRAWVGHPLCNGKLAADDVYADLDALCRSNLDAVAIFTQPWLHAPQAIQALESGKHVFSAVPIIELPDGAAILDWCDKLVSAVKRSGRQYMLGETAYYYLELMFCRREARRRAFGDIACVESQYTHHVDAPGCSLREVRRHRLASAAGREWQSIEQDCRRRGAIDGPMHYPTHSTCGPISVLGEPMVKVSCFGQPGPPGDNYFDGRLANEIALFRSRGGAIGRCIEARRMVGRGNYSVIGVFGSDAAFDQRRFRTLGSTRDVVPEEMRDALPPEVLEAYRACGRTLLSTRTGHASDQYLDEDLLVSTVEEATYGGHGGSHAFMIHEFVDAVCRDRHPAINVWEAVRYMAAGVAAHRSALKGGETLAVPDWGDPP